MISLEHLEDARPRRIRLAVLAALALAAMTAAACGENSAIGAEEDDGGAASPDGDGDGTIAANDDAGGTPADATGADGSSNADDGSGNTDDGSGDGACKAGLAGCIGDDRLVCKDDGSAWSQEVCAEGLRCFDGVCAECGEDADCDAGKACAAAVCTVAPLKVVTQALPVAAVGTPYAAQLEATGGVAPYAWSLPQGKLPDGLLLAADGTMGGSATVATSASVLVRVEDDQGDQAEAILTIDVKDGGLVITTTSPLKKAIEGEKYSIQLEASGGEPPTFWGLVDGSLPDGLSLGATGLISGAATIDGTFTFTVKALDNGAPTLTASRLFDLPVGLAPLEIVGSQQINLFITKIIALPLIIVVKDVPVPYSAQLEAKGGKKPYTWVETPLPGALSSFVPNGGIPAGLKLSADGKLSGSVSDPSLVVKLKIPLSQIELEGFFFAAKVTDSQAKPESKTAIFIMPTVPIGGP